jgi:hypothetical protein
VQRVNYFDGELLTADDLTLDQKYHIDRLQRHHLRFHTPGIADGLTVGCDNGATSIRVMPGVAVDNQGRLITVDGVKPWEVPLPSPPLAKGEYFFAIEYGARNDAKETTADQEQFRRVTEEPKPSYLPAPPAATSPQIVLAKVRIGDDGKTADASPTDLTQQQKVGVKAPVVSTGTLELEPKAGGSPVRVEAPQAGQIEIQGDLHLTGSFSPKALDVVPVITKATVTFDDSPTQATGLVKFDSHREPEIARKAPLIAVELAMPTGVSPPAGTFITWMECVTAEGSNLVRALLIRGDKTTKVVCTAYVLVLDKQA